MIVASVVASQPAHAIDAFFPSFGNSGYDVIHYDLDLDVSLNPYVLDGRARLAVRAEERLSQFTLDLAGLTVGDVRVDGRRARFSQAGDKLTIMPQREIPRGKRFSVAISYGGSPQPIQDPTAPGDPSVLLGWTKYLQSTYVVSEPVGASTFFPANDEPTDKASFDITVTVPDTHTAVANGELRWRQEFGGKRRFVWEMKQPMTTWLATVHINQFQVTKTRTRDGTPLSFYTTAATPPEDIAGYAKSAEMLPYFETLVGRYPFHSYGSVVVDDPALYYALETQAMSTFPVGVADEAIVAHELAHQWFGNSVSVGEWRDLWLAEGTATYFEVAWTNRGDDAGFNNEMRGIYDYVAQQNIGPAVVESGDQIFTDRTYLRGSAALYALQLQVGKKTFFKILRNFAQHYRGDNASSADFIDTAAWVSRDPAVRGLLNAWLYEQAVPALPGQQARTAQRQAPVPVPDVVGTRCEGGAHRSGPSARCEVVPAVAR